MKSCFLERSASVFAVDSSRNANITSSWTSIAFGDEVFAKSRRSCAVATINDRTDSVERENRESSRIGLLYRGIERKRDLPQRRVEVAETSGKDLSRRTLSRRADRDNRQRRVATRSSRWSEKTPRRRGRNAREARRFALANSPPKTRAE